jgi:2-(1,2-epoxy-1,2-dihydrophenyl)acetyl-CoA isomerase
MNQFNCLEFSQDGSVATITLNRPDAGNAFNLELASELNNVARQCREDSSIRAVILTGNGKLFCAGGDLASMAEAGDKVDLALKDLTDQCHEAYATLLSMPAPVVVAVNGASAGIGVSLTLIGDITIASEKASFTMAYTAAGLTPDGGATYLLPRAIGYKRAKEMMITNRKVNRSANPGTETGQGGDPGLRLG